MQERAKFEHDTIRAEFIIEKAYRRVITQLVKENPEIYYNESHFYRVAVLRLVREHGKRI